jgi:hypothetical protein
MPNDTDEHTDRQTRARIYGFQRHDHCHDDSNRRMVGVLDGYKHRLSRAMVAESTILLLDGARILLSGSSICRSNNSKHNLHNLSLHV